MSGSPAVVGRSLRLSVGMLTAIPVPAVLRVSPGVARGALLAAPVAVLPLGAVVAAVLLAGDRLSLPPWGVAFVALGALAASTRALHLDGLSDVADGLTASYDPERSLAVMKGGTAGPAGAAALVIVLGAQAAGLTVLVGVEHGPVLAGAAVCASRLALWVACCRVVPPARPDGLGATFTGRIPVLVAILGGSGLAALAALVDPVGGPVTVGVAALAVVALVRRCVRRFGGVTGDVLGASIETAFAVLLLGAAATLSV